jgi:hypothetical protein
MKIRLLLVWFLAWLEPAIPMLGQWKEVSTNDVHLMLGLRTGSERASLTNLVIAFSKITLLEVILSRTPFSYLSRTFSVGEAGFL